MVKKRGFVSHLRPEADSAGRNVSWGSILAGIVTFFALMIMFSLIGSAIGLGVTDVTSNDPFDGVGTGLIIWVVLSLLISLFAAGFVSGITAGRVGLVHGFLTWATSVILLMVLLTATTINTFQTVGSVLGTVGGAAGQGVSTVAGSAGDAISSGFDSVTDNFSEINTDELQGNVEEILADTDIPELQPDYLQGQLDEVRQEVTDAGQEVLTNPENFDATVQELGDSLQTRAEEIQQSVDEEAIANAVAENTELSEAEAEEATQNIVDGLNEATTQASEQIENARVALEDASAELETQVEELRQQAEEVTDTAAQASIWGFVALLLAMIVTSVGGLFGSGLVRKEDRV